ncbi:MAG: DUF3298 and DUF4163 domain-containing protein [Prevotellaceae bacterium]|jgi:hypothetical protein|nr:DUF3298 and DUF4163 domain-containing protein [Prevotellaceae bacterium]
MKYKSIFGGLISVVLLSICISSCKEQTIKVKSLNYADRFFLVPADTLKGALGVSIQVEIPESYVEQNVLNVIRNTLISNIFGVNYLTVPEDSIPLLYFKQLSIEYKNDCEPIVSEFAEKDPLMNFNHEHVLEGFTVLNTPSIYSYGFDRYVFSGGAHGLNTSNYLNFDLKDGHVINENDLFVAGYETQLIALLKQGIVEQSDLKDLEQSPYWTDSIKPNSNFYISDVGITYVFNPFEIAPYYVGKTEVTLFYADIVPLLKQGNPIAYLVNESKEEE